MPTIAEKQAELSALQVAHAASRPYVERTFRDGAAPDAATLAYQAETQAIGDLQREITALTAEAAEAETLCLADVAATEPAMTAVKDAFTALAVALGAVSALNRDGAYHASQHRALTGSTTYGAPATLPTGFEVAALLAEVAREQDELAYTSGGTVDRVNFRHAFRIPA